MEKYSVEWKEKQGQWYQKHEDGFVYRHYIENDTEYSQKTVYFTLKEAEENEPLTHVTMKEREGSKTNRGIEMKYILTNERYGNEAVEVTIDELRALLRDVFGDTETELEERADGIYEVGGELVAEPVDSRSQAAATLGRLGRAAMTEAQAEASRRNGRKGGRPRKSK